MEKHYVTMGQTHTHSINGRTIDKDCVVVFEVENYEQGREKCFEYFGDKFATSYHGKEWKEDNLKFFPRGYIHFQ